MFFNAGPRKNWNTHKMLESAKAGAEEAGADCRELPLTKGSYSSASATATT